MNSHHPAIKAAFLAATFLATPLAFMAPQSAFAQVAVSVGIQIAPPALPVYVQPPMPAVGYIWTPGYWAYAPTGYYWVPGAWVLPPSVGVLWTPPYWAWINGAYVFHAGYWGPHVGFYGGVNYGFGYTGHGYYGGRWNGGRFAYNRAVNNFGSVRVTNVYNKTVINENRTRVSYVGGPHGLRAEPTAQQRAYQRERHTPATSVQTRHVETARANPAFALSHNHGHPVMPAAQRAPENPRAPQRMNAEHPPMHAAPHPGGMARPPERNVAHPPPHPAPGAPPRPMEHAAPHPAPRPAAHPPQYRAPQPRAPQYHAPQQRMEHAAPRPAGHAPTHQAPHHEERPDQR